MKLLMNKVFDNLIVDTLSNKKPQSFVTDLFITSRKINISLVFITQSYFVVLKSISRNPIQYFIIKHPTTQSFTKFQSIMYLIMTFMTSGSFAKNVQQNRNLSKSLIQLFPEILEATF